MRRPLVSCLMATAGRQRLAERAVQCFCDQTWKARELVIVDDGDEDYSAMLEPYRLHATIHYHRIVRPPERLRLGAIRNLALDRANGEFLVQWDDDEWYHPERIDAQMNALEGGFGASVLRYTLMHLDLPQYVHHPCRRGLRRGTPGTVLSRRTSLRYPHLARGEDSAYLGQLRRAVRVKVLGIQFSHLFIRCFHGVNTWDRQHFLDGLHYSAVEKAQYAYARWIRRDVFAHRAFALNEQERMSVHGFIQQTQDLGLWSAETSGLP